MAAIGGFAVGLQLAEAVSRLVFDGRSSTTTVVLERPLPGASLPMRR